MWYIWSNAHHKIPFIVYVSACLFVQLIQYQNDNFLIYGKSFLSPSFEFSFHIKFSVNYIRNQFSRNWFPNIWKLKMEQATKKINKIEILKKKLFHSPSVLVFLIWKYFRWYFFKVNQFFVNWPKYVFMHTQTSV